MDKYKKILVVIDPTTSDQKALKRAIHLAKLTQAKITAFLSIYDFSYEMTTILSGEERESMCLSVVKDREQWVEALIEDTHCEDVNISSKVVWHNRPFESIINEVLNENYDLVIKGTHEHDKLKSVIFTPTDWHILRKCPCPILLVKDHSWPINGKIIAALNIASDMPEHISLNNDITNVAQSLAHLTQAELHLVNSYPGAPVNISIEIPEFNSLEYCHTMRKHHQKSMAAHIKKFNVPIKETHVKEGLPEDVIEAVSKELDAELVVLGCIGRTGFSAALIGNTAEHVIDQLNCDLLAIKPKDYVSPLAK